MKKSMFLIAVLFVMNGCAFHDPWTHKDTYRHATMTGLMIIDWRQTRQIADNPHKYCELNPILNEHPSTQEVDLYFASSWILTTGIVYYLPTKWRKRGQYICIGLTAGCVINNYSIGLRMEW